MPYSQTDNDDFTDLASDISLSDREDILSQHQDTFDAIEALKAPAEEPAPMVAEFVSEPWTPEPAEATLADLDGALADLDLDTPDLDSAPASNVKPMPKVSRAVLDALRSADRDALIADNKANGWTAQGYDEIEEYRRTEPGRTKYNANRRAKRLEEALKKGRTMRRSVLNPATPKQKADDNNKRQAKYRKNQTPEQRKAENAKRTERRRKQKERTEAEAKAALDAQALFS